MIKAIENAINELTAVDAAGWGLVILRADRNADIRRVIENYPHIRTPEAKCTDNDSIYAQTGSPNIKETIAGGQIKDFLRKIKNSNASNRDSKCSKSEDLLNWLEEVICGSNGNQKCKEKQDLIAWLDEDEKNKDEKNKEVKSSENKAKINLLALLEEFKKKRPTDLVAWLEDCISEETGLIYRLTFIPNSDDVIGEEKEDSAKVIALIKEICEEKRKGKNHALVVIGSKTGVICDELAEYAYTIDVGCPDEKEIADIIDAACKEFGGTQHGLSAASKNEIAAIFRGMREDDIRAVINLAYAQNEKPAANDAEELFKAVIDAKKQCITGVKGLHWEKNNGTSEVGGMEKAKEWLKIHGYSFRYSFAAEKCKVPPPKGVLLAGLPGCGKTLFAQMASAILNDSDSKRSFTPILKLDLNTVQGGFVGDSEANLANALRMIENVAPCIVIIDEIEKFFEKSGNQGGGHEVTRHLLSTLLDWMQTKRSKPVLVIATANEIDNLPPELKRKGRFDETFFVGVPTCEDCKTIFEIHFNKRRKVLDKEFFNADNKFSEKYKEVVDKFFRMAALEHRFFNGADIESIIDAAFCSLFAQKMGYRIETNSNASKVDDNERKNIIEGEYTPKYSVAQVEEALLAELKETRSYFDNNIKKTAEYWTRMKELNFRDSGENDLFKAYKDNFDPEQGKFKFATSEPAYGEKTNAGYIRDGFYDKNERQKGYSDFLEDSFAKLFDPDKPSDKPSAELYDEAFRYKLAINIYKYVQGRKRQA